MKDALIGMRNRTHRFFYTKMVKPVFFRMDPEDVHERTTKLGVFLGRTLLGRGITRILFHYENPMLEQRVAGIRFKNPVGLAAGFDKDAQLTQVLPDLGFGFEEVGSITGEPCEGNPRPRLWRLPKSKALVVWYGLKNDGAEVLSKRLRRMRFRFPVGISVAKTNSETTIDTDAGIKDYVKAYTLFKDIGSYTTINISCPNTFGGQPFTDREKFEALMKKVVEVETKKPIFIKMSPDLTKRQLDDIISVSLDYGVAGLICSNLTKNYTSSRIRDPAPTKGGISGKVVEELSLDHIRYIRKKAGDKLTLIACGGIFTADDAYRRIKAGASLIQLITGMVYQGPQTISEINRGLVKLMKNDGYANISEAVGADLKK